MYSKLKTMTIFAVLIEALLVANLWIILYTKTVDYFNFQYPAAYVETLGNPLALPEPYEIPLYIFLSLIFVMVIWLYHNIAQKTLEKIPLLVKFFFFFFLLILFVKKIGDFPLSADPYPYSIRSDKEIYLLVLGFYLIFILLFTLETYLLKKILAKKIAKIIIFTFLALTIGFLTFEAGLAISPLDASFFYGPAWEIAHAKSLFTDVPSVYGLLSILFFSLIYKIVHINFVYLPILIWLFYLVEYFIGFYLIYRVSASLPFSLFALFSIVTTNYFSLYRLPQGGPVRWLPFFLLLFLFYKVKKIDSKLLLLLLPMLVFWNIDSGITLLLGYLLTLGLFFLLKKINLKRLLSAGFFLALSTLLTVVVIGIIHLIISHKLIGFFGLFDTVRRNAVEGVLMIPMDPKTYFWLVILTYFATIIYLVSQKMEDGKWKMEGKFLPSTFYPPSSNALGILLFSANLMFFVSIYYVGRSMPHNLFLISPFFLLTFFLLMGSSYKLINSTKIKLLVLSFIFLAFIIFPGYQRKEFLASELINKYHRLLQTDITSSENDKILKQMYEKDVEFMKKNLHQDTIAIISTDDTYLFYFVGKKNLLNANPLIGINMKYEMEKALKPLEKACPEKIVVDCQIYKKCPPYKSFTKGWPDILPLVLAQMEKKCAVKYSPTVCADYLCIAEGVK